MITEFELEVEKKRKEALARIDTIPVSALLWGPTPTAGTPVANARNAIRNTLSGKGHLARFSEELMDPTSTHSLLAQQMAQAEAYDIVFSVPDSPGSIAEIHDFARVPWLSHKIVAFLNEEWNSGYANKTLLELQSTITCQIQLYKPAQLPHCVVDCALSLVNRLQEIYYYTGRRF
jgi:hypothetical protein